MVLMWIIFILVIIVFLFLYSNMYFSFRFTYTSHQLVCTIEIYLYRLRIFQQEIKLDDNNEDNEIWRIWKDKSLQELIDVFQADCRNVFQKMGDLNCFVRSIFQKISVHELKWFTHVGTGEASTTGLAAGSIWAFKEVLVGFISNQSKIYCKPKIGVHPYFQFKCIQSTFNCIVSVKIGQAIHVFLKAMRKTSFRKEAAFIK